MTSPSEPKQNNTPVPEIVSDEDSPFDSAPIQSNNQTSLSNSTDNELSKVKSAKELDLRKFNLGSSMLGWCLFLMMLCISLSIWKPDNELIKNGFEAFKLIVMTILGYIFGSNSAKND